MRTFRNSILALGMVGMMAVPVMAQQGRGGGRGFGGGGGMGMGVGMLLSNTGVQQELKLEAAQVEKVKAISDKAREKMMASRDALEGLDGEARMKKVQELGKEINAEALKSAKEILNADQLKRLGQIRNQALGASALIEESIQSELKLTAAQKTEIQELIQESSREVRELMSGFQDDPEGTRTKMTELRKGTLSKVESKLTDEQKTAWKELLGSPYELKLEFPGGVRRGLGGGR